MPDTIANPAYGSSPLGQALANMSRVLMSGPDEATRIAQAEQALKLKRTREGTTSLADVFTRYGQPGFDRNAAVSNAITAGYDPKNLAESERYLASNSFGATDPRTTNAFVGAGGAYGSTAAGTREAEAANMARTQATIGEQRRQFDSKPISVGTPNGPVISRTADAYGQPAVESLSNVQGDLLRRGMNQPGGVGAMPQPEQRIVGAEAKTTPTPRNYSVGGQNIITYDGVTEANTGRPLPPGGAIASLQGGSNDVGLRPNVQGKLQEADIAGQRLKRMISFTRDLAQKDASNFGVSGMVKGLTQDIGQMANNVATGMGYTGIQEAVSDVGRRAAASGVNPSLLQGIYSFDPNLPALHTAADLMVYQAAEVLAGQSGRSVSDKDVARITRAVGDPRSWRASQEEFLSKMNTIEAILDMNQDVVGQNLGRPTGAAPPAAPAVQAAPGAAPPAAPGAPQSPRPRAVNPQTGQRVEFDGQQWVPAQ